MGWNLSRSFMVFYLSIYCQINSHFIDTNRGIITYNDGPVFVYDSVISIPIVLSIPTKLPVANIELNTNNGCDIIGLVNEKMELVTREVSERLPEISPITNRKQLKDMILDDGRFKVHHSIPPVDLFAKTSNELNRVHHMNKRGFWFIFLGIGAIASLGAVVAWNRYDIEHIGTSVLTLNENQQLLKDRVETNTNNINLIRDNQAKISMMVNELTEKLNELIKDYNCRAKQQDVYLNLINSWSTIAPNSFIRALNGALDQKLTIDLIPGKNLQSILKFYPEFSGTIFEEDPYLVYKSARVILTKINKYPPSLEAVVVIPRILLKQFGSYYIQKSCHWSENSVTVALDHTSRGIRSVSDDSWWDDISCLEKDSARLCNIQEIRPLHNPCLHGISLKNNKTNITGCKVRLEQSRVSNEVVQTRDGILVCYPNKHVTTFKKNEFQMVKATVIDLEKPMYFTKNDADSVLVGSNHYTLAPSEIEINITTMNMVHDILQSNDTIDEIRKHGELSFVPYTNPNLRLHSISIKHHNIAIFIIIIVILLITLGIAFLFWKNRKQHVKSKRYMGYLYNTMKNKNENGSSTTEEKREDNITLNNLNNTSA